MATKEVNDPTSLDMNQVLHMLKQQNDLKMEVEKLRRLIEQMVRGTCMF